MKFIPLAIPDVILIKPEVFEDSRGFFLESYNARVFSKNGIKDIFVQDNHSKSAKGAVRGLHADRPAVDSEVDRHDALLSLVLPRESSDARDDLSKEGPCQVRGRRSYNGDPCRRSIARSPAGPRSTASPGWTSGGR